MEEYKKVTEEYEQTLFTNYQLTDLMLLEKNGKKVKSNNNTALTIILEQKLLQYGISIFGVIKSSNLVFRAIRLLDGFPIENESIFKQLYGYENINVNIQLKGFDSFAVAFDYDLDSGKCELQRHSWGTITHKLHFNSFTEMMSFIKENDYETIFD